MKEKRNARSRSAKKPLYKKWWFWVIIVVVLGAVFGSADSSGGGAPGAAESHIYDDAQVKDVMNGIRTNKIGEYSIIEISSEEVTDEALADWYFNYVEKNDFNFCMILYSDKDDNSGVYAANGVVQKDVRFTEDENGDYALRDADATSHAITYVPAEDNTLKVMEFDK